MRWRPWEQLPLLPSPYDCDRCGWPSIIWGDDWYEVYLWCPRCEADRLTRSFYSSLEARRAAVWKWQTVPCVYCGDPEGAWERSDFHLEHVHPRSRFPTVEDHPGNFVMACSACNLSKGTLTPGEWLDELVAAGRPVPARLRSFVAELNEWDPMACGVF